MQNYLISGLAPKKVSIFLSLSSYTKTATGNPVELAG